MVCGVLAPKVDPPVCVRPGCVRVVCAVITPKVDPPVCVHPGRVRVIRGVLTPKVDPPVCVHLGCVRVVCGVPAPVDPLGCVVRVVCGDDDDCFNYHSWRNYVVIAFGTLSSCACIHVDPLACVHLGRVRGVCGVFAPKMDPWCACTCGVLVFPSIDFLCARPAMVFMLSIFTIVCTNFLVYLSAWLGAVNP